VFGACEVVFDVTERFCRRFFLMGLCGDCRTLSLLIKVSTQFQNKRSNFRDTVLLDLVEGSPIEGIDEKDHATPADNKRRFRRTGGSSRRTTPRPPRARVINFKSTHICSNTSPDTIPFNFERVEVPKTDILGSEVCKKTGELTALFRQKTAAAAQRRRHLLAPSTKLTLYLPNSPSKDNMIYLDVCLFSLLFFYCFGIVIVEFYVCFILRSLKMPPSKRCWYWCWRLPLRIISLKDWGLEAA
jgi:hypothetical protein